MMWDKTNHFCEIRNTAANTVTVTGNLREFCLFWILLGIRGRACPLLILYL